MMGMPGLTPPPPNPLADGLYWRLDDEYQWHPMLVRAGVQYPLVMALGHGGPETLPDFAITVSGPLCIPGTPR
jgi:hypothetical protein